jgi:hypothetical protein
MDFCRCGKTGVDLEIYLTRRMGTPKTWEVIKGTKEIFKPLPYSVKEHVTKKLLKESKRTVPVVTNRTKKKVKQ